MERLPDPRWFIPAVILYSLLFFGVVSSFGAEIPEAVAIKCLMGEARGEGQRGMQLVGEVLRRRGNTQGMYGCNAKFNAPEWVRVKAKKAWADSAKSNITNRATHFESIKFETPYWAKSMDVVYKFKNHVFYKEK